jgi:signal transduction histidine kinase
VALFSLPTQFAPAARAPRRRLEQQHRSLQRIPLLRPLFDAVPDVVLILNTQRQIVFANRALENLTRLDPKITFGMRPGEAVDCRHAFDTQGGCGTTEFCRTCGAVQAVLAGLDGNEALEECRIALHNGDALDLQVIATPLTLDGELFAFCVLKDISDEKRRRMLEHVFFHDILNSAGALRGLADLLVRAPIPDKNEIAGDVWSVADRMIDEIKSQKLLAAAENNELLVEHSPLQVKRFLQELIHSYQEHEAGRGRRILLDPHTRDVTLQTDRTLLWRVLGNMLKNALEATAPGETVTLGCRLGMEQVELWVHNPGEIPEPARLQIFQRSFSTKGAGRGLGTYSIKLLGERYLGGQVSFTTSAAQGTTFRLRLPTEE